MLIVNRTLDFLFSDYFRYIITETTMSCTVCRESTVISEYIYQSSAPSQVTPVPLEKNISKTRKMSKPRIMAK